MIVVDTSAIVEFLLGSASRAALIDRISGDGSLHAPYLIDIEVLQSIRGLLHGREIDRGRAVELRDEYDSLRVTRYPHQPLSDRVWELRDNLTAYDAAFVALSESLGAPLVTRDARMANAPGVTAVVEVY